MPARRTASQLAYDADPPVETFGAVVVVAGLGVGVGLAVALADGDGAGAGAAMDVSAPVRRTAAAAPNG